VLYSRPVMTSPRLRQVALVAEDGPIVSALLQETFDWPDPFHDPGVAEFGLSNSVFEVGDTFVEVVSPMRPNTAAGRHLSRLGGDGGYMAIFQVAGREEARRRLDELGVTVVWSIDLADISTSHLHPRDDPGALVSIDWADPPQSWRWAGPRWIGDAPTPRAPGGLVGLTVEVDEPGAVARTWAGVLGLAAIATANAIDLAGQRIEFVAPGTGPARGITGVTISGAVATGPVRIAGVEFTIKETP
jgi:hypothetical protein